jgi:hypothetical protein
VASLPATLGLRAHSGWAALVAIAGGVDAPSVIDRRILQLANPKTSGSKQPYHAAEPLPFSTACQLVERCTEETYDLACTGLRATIAELQHNGFRIAGCGLIVKSRRTLPSLEGILASHALIHAAEGQLFRDALGRGAIDCGLLITGVNERELVATATGTLGCSADQLDEHLAQIGRSLGPPWREDQKCATLAAWIVLAKAAGRRPEKRAAAD